MALRLLLVGLVAVSSADVETPKQADLQQKTYQGAAQGAREALQRIRDLQRSVETKARNSLEGKEKEAEEHAQSELGIGMSRKQLSEHFLSLQKEAASEVAKSDLDAASASLLAMKDADKKLRELSRHTLQNLEAASRSAEDLGRDTARSAEGQVDHLTRAAREKTDHLSRVARRYDLPDLSDRLDRAAAAAAWKVQDAAERGARVVEDAARGLPRQFSRNEAEAERSRKHAIAITRELIDSHDKAPAMLDSKAPQVFSLVAFVAFAAAAGAASAVAAVYLLRQSDEVEDKYLLVV